MSVPIQHSGAQGAGQGGAPEGARPQLRSRRVSLQLGPLGITYAIDQVLWSGEAAAALEEEAQAAGPSVARDAAWQEAERRQAPSFQQELAAAWSEDARQRAARALTYGPDGTLRRDGSGEAGDAQEPGEANAAEAPRRGEPTEAARGPARGSRAGAERARDAWGQAPAGRMRRAIAAYLRCAGDCGDRGPLLCAVA